MKIKTYEKILLFFTAIVIFFSAGFVLGRKTAVHNIVIEGTAGVASPSSQPSTSETLININTANAEELATLPGIGSKIANAIIAYRDNHGGFKTIGEITEVDGIGGGIYEQIRTLITV